MILVINLWGGPGAGKTRMAHYLMVELTKAGYTNAHYISEAARDLIYAGQKEMVETNQLAVLMEQFNKLIRLKKSFSDYDGHTIIISDSPLQSQKIYAGINQKKGMFSTNLIEQTIKEMDAHFNNIHIECKRHINNEYVTQGRLDYNIHEINEQCHVELQKCNQQYVLYGQTEDIIINNLMSLLNKVFK